MIDFRQASTGAFGSDARAVSGDAMLLWCGDADGDGRLAYVGSGNDRDPILVQVGGSPPTASTTGYLRCDITMDGVARYVGSGNDRDPILQNIGGAAPTAIRLAQLP
ncbi:MAG: hypothetical protein ACK4L7_01765, partial [Flavobacteriales bacterium]